MEQISNKHYDALNGLRAFSAIGIALMHIMFNGNYNIGGFVGEKFIGYMGELVYLFMIISAFSMCCGYFEKISKNQISPSAFYARRFEKIFPFFALMCVLDFAVAPSVNTAAELFAELTLCFGLLPNPCMSVIGVGWFIGLIFVFYICFPFFCTLIENKRRAWLFFAVSVVFSLLCRFYFFDENHIVNMDYRANIIYVSPYFFAGGLIYLYRDTLSVIADKAKYIVLIACIGAAALYFWKGKYFWAELPLFSLLVIYGLQSRSLLLDNRVTKFLSSISMEIYLCHMLFFKALQKVKLTHLFGSDVASYIVTSVMVIALAVAFSFLAKKAFAFISQRLKKRS